MIRFTAEQEEFRRAVARFVDAEVVPAADAIDESAEFPRKLRERRPIPVRRQGLDGVLAALALEQIDGARPDRTGGAKERYCALRRRSIDRSAQNIRLHNSPYQ